MKSGWICTTLCIKVILWRTFTIYFVYFVLFEYLQWTCITSIITITIKIFPLLKKKNLAPKIVSTLSHYNYNVCINKCVAHPRGVCILRHLPRGKGSLQSWVRTRPFSGGSFPDLLNTFGPGPESRLFMGWDFQTDFFPWALSQHYFGSVKTVTWMMLALPGRWIFFPCTVIEITS